MYLTCFVDCFKSLRTSSFLCYTAFQETAQGLTEKLLYLSGADANFVSDENKKGYKITSLQWRAGRLSTIMAMCPTVLLLTMDISFQLQRTSVSICRRLRWSQRFWRSVRLVVICFVHCYTAKILEGSINVSCSSSISHILLCLMCSTADLNQTHYDTFMCFRFKSAPETIKQSYGKNGKHVSSSRNLGL